MRATGDGRYGGAPAHRGLEGQGAGPYTAESFDALSRAAHALVARQYQLYNDELLPAFAEHGIHVISHGKRNAAQRKWVHEYFEREVRPLLIPVALDPAHPFPQVANKSLNFIVKLSGKDAFGRENPIAILKVPRPTDKVPFVEQTYSAGAVCLSLLNAAAAAGWGANWLTGWPAYDEEFRAKGLRLAPGETVAGVIHVGTPTAEAPDRPRPDVEGLTTWVEA